MPDAVDVAVVGCGPVGALAGSLFSDAGFTTLVADKAERPYDLPRAIHFDAQIMRLFQQVGVAARIESRLEVWNRSVFTGADGDVLRVHEFPTEWVEGWAPHYLFYQPELEAELRAALRRRDVDIRLGHELVGLEQGADTVGLEFRGPGGSTAVDARWVIGCDGASSTVRKQLGVHLRDMAFDEPWLVVDARVARGILPPDSHMACDPERPSTLIQGRGDHRRWEFMLLPGEDPDVMSDPVTVDRLLSRWVDPASVDVQRAAVYRFHALVAEEWRRRRVFLAGDAAHQTPPFLGQGMCHGMRDVSNLVWKLRWAEDDRGDHSILDSYEEERAPHVEEIIAMAVDSGREICMLDRNEAEQRDRRIRHLSRSGELPTSPFVGMPPLRHGLIGEGRGAGRLFPQPMVAVDGQRARLDDLVGQRFALVTAGEASGETEALADRLGAVLIDAAVADESHVIDRWLYEFGARGALVRPDRYAYETVEDQEDLPGAVDRLLRRLVRQSSTTETRA